MKFVKVDEIRLRDGGTIRDTSCALTEHFLIADTEKEILWIPYTNIVMLSGVTQERPKTGGNVWTI